MFTIWADRNVHACLLIVDGIATNRVALKVRLNAAWYDVQTADTARDAMDKIARHRPSLILCSDTLPDQDLVAFARQVQADKGDTAPPLLAFSQDKNTRVALLEAGVQDVLQHQESDPLLISAIRSIIRAHAAESEWRLRDGTNRALGFAEGMAPFSGVVPVTHLSPDHTAHVPSTAKERTADPLEAIAGLQVHKAAFETAMRDMHREFASSVVVVDLPQYDKRAALGLISDLRANLATRHTAILVRVPENGRDLAAQALDLGADEAVLDHVAPAELGFRIKRLHARSCIHRSLRTSVRNGAEAALRDPLTGLYNRRYAIPHLERIAEQSARSGRPFAVMIADLDHFKQINDLHGHSVGDAVLTECSDRLNRNMRSVDMVARIGGEEFLIVLPNTDKVAARQAALRLCRRISEQPIHVDGLEQPVKVTVSIGLALAEFPKPNEACETQAAQDLEHTDALLHRADKALYRAKEMGRNRYMVERTAA